VGPWCMKRGGNNTIGKGEKNWPAKEKCKKVVRKEKLLITFSTSASRRADMNLLHLPDAKI